MSGDRWDVPLAKTVRIRGQEFDCHAISPGRFRARRKADTRPGPNAGGRLSFFCGAAITIQNDEGQAHGGQVTSLSDRILISSLT